MLAGLVRRPPRVRPLVLHRPRVHPVEEVADFPAGTGRPAARRHPTRPTSARSSGTRSGSPGTGAWRRRYFSTAARRVVGIGLLPPPAVIRSSVLRAGGANGVLRPGTRTPAPLRQRRGPGGGPAPFRARRAHQGPSRGAGRTRRALGATPAGSGRGAGRRRAAGVGPRCHRCLVERAADGARGGGRGLRRGRPERVGAAAGPGGVQGLGRRAATGQGPAGRICSA